VKCFVTFRLKPGVTSAEYEKWFRRDNVPAVRTMTSISSYRVWRTVGAAEGEPPYDYIEEMEFDDRATFDGEVEGSAAMAAMLDAWYERVAGDAIVYAVEVEQ
jgi:REDY-like protein HapK